MNLAAINSELARIGYRAVKLAKPKRKAGDLATWKPQTQAGRRCKAAMAYWAAMPKPRVSILPSLLAMFGKTLRDVQPWPHISRGNYGPALANAMSNGPALVTYLPRQEYESVVYAYAASPRTIIVCE
jgi:hypothetical protein